MRTEWPQERKNLALGVFSIVLSGGYLVATSMIESPMGGGPDDNALRLYPYFLGAAMLVLGVAYSIQQAVALWRGSVGSDTNPGDDVTTPEPNESEPAGTGGGASATSASSAEAALDGETSAGSVAVAEESTDPASVSADASGDDAGWRRYRHIIMLVLSVAYVVLMTILGFLPAMALFVAVGVFVVGKPGQYRGVRLLIPLGFGVAASLVFYLFFSEVLNVILPPGVLGIGGF